MGTLKFISVIDSVDSLDHHNDEINDHTVKNSKDNNNNTIRLNI